MHDAVAAAGDGSREVKEVKFVDGVDGADAKVSPRAQSTGNLRAGPTNAPVLKQAATSGGGLGRVSSNNAGDNVHWTPASLSAAAQSKIIGGVLGGAPTRGTARTQTGNATGGGKLRGIFAGKVEDTDEQTGLSRVVSSGVTRSEHARDFKARLDMIVASEENMDAIARKLYIKFGGDADRLPELKDLLESKWSFPPRVFPLLLTGLRRVAGQAEIPSHVDEEQWIQAFSRWLHVLQERVSGAKVSRNCFVQKRSGDDLAELYLEGKKLGEGAFGEVHLMLHKTLGVARVVKQVSKTQLGIAEEQIEAEVALLKSLDHPHIVRIFEAFETDETLLIVMDYAEGGDLASVITKVQLHNEQLEESWVCACISQIASALEYMHSKGVIHCDMKPANVMLLQPFDRDLLPKAEPHALLVDFGIAEIFEERGGGASGVKGTPAYMAPEGFEGRLTTKSDIWALGCIVYEMLSGGKRPFKSTTNVFMLYCDVANNQPDFDGLPPVARALTEQLLAKDPKVRPSAAECRLDPWFAELNERLLQTKDVKELVNFGHRSHFDRAVMFSIAARLGMQEERDLYDIFKAIDTNNDGRLSLEELSAGLLKLGMSQRDSQSLMAVLDCDQSNDISYTEFVAAALKKDENLTGRRIEHAFQTFDLDGDGSISMYELRFMLSGEGPLSDFLPDGSTVEQVMEEVSGGGEVITLDMFKAYILREGHDDDRFTNYRVGSATASGASAAQAGADNADRPGKLSALVNELDEGEADVKPGKLSDGVIKEPTKEFREFPPFHEWLTEILQASHDDASFGISLRYADPVVEAAYVAHNIPQTCTQFAFLCLVLVVYCAWSLLTSNWVWSPVISKWHEPVFVAHNIGWLSLGISGVVVAAVCHQRLKTKLPRGSTPAQVDAYDKAALRFERALCSWACLIPWVSCYFANRFRVAKLFNVDPLDTFGSMNSDYDLIVAILSTLMFLCMRTHMRFVCVLPLALSCFFGYASTAFWWGTADEARCVEVEESRAWWAWPAILMAMMAALAMAGQMVVEHHRRINFLSLYASHGVLKNTHSDDPELVLDMGGPRGANALAVTRSARLKKVLEVIRRFSESSDGVSRPMRQAFLSLLNILQSVREDVAESDRLLVIDVSHQIEKHNVAGSAREALLGMFDEAPSPEETAHAGTPPDRIDVTSTEPKKASWGWDVLSHDHPLLAPFEQLVLPVVAEACTLSGQNDAVAAVAERRARSFVQELIGPRFQTSRSSEARAALAVHSAHWLAQQTGLWRAMNPWERVALLIAAASLHCAGSGGAFAEDPVLARAVSSSRALEIYDSSGLAEYADVLRRLIKRLLARARPRSMLDDAHTVRVALEIDDNIVASARARAEVASVVIGAADFSFLALPADLHRPWTKLCTDEAADRARCQELDMAGWLSGVIEILALPMFETLSKVAGGALQGGLAAPLSNLRENSLHWKKHALRVAAVESLPLPMPLPTVPEMNFELTTDDRPKNVEQAAAAVISSAPDDPASPVQESTVDDVSTLGPEAAAALVSTLQSAAAITAPDVDECATLVPGMATIQIAPGRAGIMQSDAATLLNAPLPIIVDDCATIAPGQDLQHLRAAAQADETVEALEAQLRTQQTKVDEAQRHALPGQVLTPPPADKDDAYRTLA
jgi:calcium-dependent protein kinase